MKKRQLENKAGRRGRNDKDRGLYTMDTARID